MTFTRRLLCLVLAVNLAFIGAPLPLAAQEDPGPGDQTTPAPTDPEKPPAPPGEKPPELAPPVADPVPEAEVGQQGINGQLLDLDGTTSIPNEEVRIVDKDGTAVVKVVSGPDGKFVLPVLKDGDYVLETRGVRQPFQVKPDQPIRELKVLVPAAAFQPAGPAPTGDEDNTGTILIFVGVGVAIIVAGVATGLAIGLSGDDEDDTVIGATNNEGPTVPGVPASSQPPPGTTPAPLVREVAFAPGTTGSFGAVTPGQNPAIPVKITNTTGTPFTAVGSVTGAGFGFLPTGGGGTTSPVRAGGEIGSVAAALLSSGQSAFIPGFGEVTFWVGFEGTIPGTYTGTCTIQGPNGPLVLTLTVIVNNTGPISVSAP